MGQSKNRIIGVRGKTGGIEGNFTPTLFVEPLHIHVQRDQAVAKFWLNPVRNEYSTGFRPVEIRQIQGIIEAQIETLIEAWNEHFSE